MNIMTSSILRLFLVLLLPGFSPAALQTRSVDSIGALDCESEMAHLDVFAVELQKAPDTRGYILVYGGRRDTKRDEVQVRASRMKRYLIENRGVSSDRFTVLNGGYRENFTVELWLAAHDPSAPAASPTIKPKDVRFKRGKTRRYQEPGCFPGRHFVIES